jgi:hypothetical protein
VIPRGETGSKMTMRRLRTFLNSDVRIGFRDGSLVDRWRKRRQLRRLQAAWQALAPHEQLVNFIDILNRHPQLRKAMREALRLNAHGGKSKRG